MFIKIICGIKSEGDKVCFFCSHNKIGIPKAEKEMGASYKNIKRTMMYIPEEEQICGFKGWNRNHRFPGARQRYGCLIS